MVSGRSVFHHTKGGYGDEAAFAAADAAFREKWLGHRREQEIDQQLRVAADAVGRGG